MHDNKVRLSQDVIDKAQTIATEWGLKNARAAVEAVFRRYSDEYLYGRQSPGPAAAPLRPVPDIGSRIAPTCEALDELEDLLAM
ncbi:MAG: hypothetical protein ACFB5Z_01125 [Elainellaceae cyanobacterium]